ncbi:MAG: hypothetical protein LBJ72_05835 [Dysgonamonadaceae bacterium]|jgi:beta-mannosidase|nr:hypothetical protein [Dysgonamonadaceae bacterium]
MNVIISKAKSLFTGRTKPRTAGYYGLIILLSGLFAVTATAQTIVRDASSLEWKLSGYRPNVWRMNFNFESLTGNQAEMPDIPATVPGSVQTALKNAGLLPDWNTGLHHYEVEWTENRHWIFSAKIPDDWLSAGRENITLQCDGLDHKGLLMVNGKEAGRFDNAFIPYSFRIDRFLKDGNNTIAFVFDSPPEDLNQIGWTSRITDWKPRFYYGWDWIPRLVQIGVWDKVHFITDSGQHALIKETALTTGASALADKGSLDVRLTFDRLPVTGRVKISLTGNGKTVREETHDAYALTNGLSWKDLKIDRWQPNGVGDQPLYALQLTLTDNTGKEIQQILRRVGFRHIDWRPCEGASPGADPWICAVNNRPIFLQGVNWTPIRPYFADLKEEDYRIRLALYKELGINVIRIWGGGFAEKDWLYDLCDEMGILIWQEFPLSSSGLDNYPPEGTPEIYAMTQIVHHYVTRLRHHASLLLWCGGNELYERGDTAPITGKHPLIGEIQRNVRMLDPGRRFVPGSPSGPNIYASYDNYGSGNNWDVHGPWSLPFRDEKQNMDDVRDFWTKDDALIHSEVGVSGAMSAEMIVKYAGTFPPLPANLDNPIWRTVNWWIDWDSYLSAHDGLAPASVENYVEWSQRRQTEGLCIALERCKNRFPRCGGFIIWMGHDSFPCFINTSLIDFEGNPKPAALEISKIWKDNSYLKNK